MKQFFVLNMHQCNLCYFYFISLVCASSENDMIFDYFTYKQVSSIVGLSCNSPEDDMFLIKRFSNFGISTALKVSYDDMAIELFAMARYRRIGIFIDMRCYNESFISSIFFEASDHRMFDELHNWFVISDNLEMILGVMNDDGFEMSTDFVIAVPPVTVTDSNYEIYDSYNSWKERGTKLNITSVGSWNEIHGLRMNLIGTKFQRRADLQGLTMRTSFFWSKYKPDDMALEDYLQDYSTSPKDGLSKFGFTLVRCLADMFNFKIKSDTAAKWEVGDSLGPILRALINDEIDITGSPATMSVKRTYLVKYIYQAWPFRTCFIFRNPQPKNIKVNEVLGPLDIPVWYASLLLFLISAWILAVLYRRETMSSTFIHYSDAILTVLGAVCQQSSDARMNNISTRIAFFHIMMFSVIFYTFYSASIVFARLDEPISKMNDSLSQLAKSGLKVSSEWMVYFELFIKKTDWETKTFYTNVWQNIPEAERFMEPGKAMRLVQEGGFAYHMHPDVGYPFVNEFFDNRQICELMEVHLASPTHSTFAVRINSTFGEMIKIGLMKISEVGIRRRQLERWTTRKPHCQKNVLRASPIDIYEFAPHLVILMFGTFLACLIYLLEVIKTKYSEEYWLRKTVTLVIRVFNKHAEEY